MALRIAGHAAARAHGEAVANPAPMRRRRVIVAGLRERACLATPGRTAKLRLPVRHYPLLEIRWFIQRRFEP